MVVLVAFRYRLESTKDGASPRESWMVQFPEIPRDLHASGNIDFHMLSRG